LIRCREPLEEGSGGRIGMKRLPAAQTVLGPRHYEFARIRQVDPALDGGTKAPKTPDSARFDLASAYSLSVIAFFIPAI